MRNLVGGLAVCGVILLGLAQGARATDMSGYFGNTVLVMGAHGNVKLYMNADGTYTADAGGQTTKGTWTDDGSKTCMTQTEPRPVPATCHPSESHKVGDTWAIPGPGTATIVAGRP